MNRKVADILFVLFLFVGMVTYLFYTQSYRIILSGQVGCFLATTDFFTSFLPRIQGIVDYLASFLVQFYVIRYFGIGVLISLAFLLGLLINMLLKPFTESRYRILLSFLYSTTFVWSLHSFSDYPLSKDLTLLISFICCRLYIGLSDKRIRVLFSYCLACILWYICKEAAFVACLYIFVYEYLKGMRNYSYLISLCSLFAFSALFTTLLLQYCFPMEEVFVAEWELDWYPWYLIYMISFVGCIFLLRCTRRYFFVASGYLLLVIYACYVNTDRIREFEIKLFYLMQQSEWNKLLGSIGDVKKLNSRTLNYYYMALAQTGQLSNALFRDGFPYSKSLVSAGEQSYVSKTRLSDIYWNLGCFRASQVFSTEAMSMLDTGVNPYHLKRLAMIHLIYRENDLAIKLLRILKKTVMYNRWAVDLLNRMKHDPDLEQVDWIIRFRKMLPSYGFQIGMNRPLENITNLAIQLPFETLALEYAWNLALLEKKVDWVARMVRYKLDFSPNSEIPILCQEGILIYERENKISEDRKLKINYDEGVLARFKEYCTQGKRPLNTISGYLVMNNDYKSSYFYYYESVDVHK